MKNTCIHPAKYISYTSSNNDEEFYSCRLCKEWDLPKKFVEKFIEANKYADELGDNLENMEESSVYPEFIKEVERRVWAKDLHKRIMRLQDTLQKDMDDHDCHRSPDDGCSACEKFNSVITCKECGRELVIRCDSQDIDGNRGEYNYHCPGCD